MNFEGHVKGAFLTAGAVAGIALLSGQVELELSSLEEFVKDPLSPGAVRRLLGITFLTWFMGLFPDMDIQSTPRKHTVRWIFLILVLLYIVGDLHVLAFVSLLAFATGIHRHRGWTHWVVTPWVLSLFLALGAEYLRARDSWFFGFSLSNVLHFLKEQWIYTLAFVSGHYTHLVLDSSFVKRLRTERAESGGKAAFPRQTGKEKEAKKGAKNRNPS